MRYIFLVALVAAIFSTISTLAYVTPAERNGLRTLEDPSAWTPEESTDGTCSEYLVQAGETCLQIAARHGLTDIDIDTFNNGTTWGWTGCQNIHGNMNICVSAGTAPLPNPVDGAKCGPTVPGTELPTNGAALSDLNPCPINACCDITGQCGITPAYCTVNIGPSGNPGTAPLGENGCISNFGTDIANNEYGPATFISVGIYESWNRDRSCLTMRMSEIDASVHTHVHWAYATLDENFNIVINDTYNQWNAFKALPTKRIVSIGDWSSSTNTGIYNKLREAMSPENLNYITFADNVIRFLNDEGLDGVDFD